MSQHGGDPSNQRGRKLEARMEDPLAKTVPWGTTLPVDDAGRLPRGRQGVPSGTDVSRSRADSKGDEEKPSAPSAGMAQRYRLESEASAAARPEHHSSGGRTVLKVLLVVSALGVALLFFALVALGLSLSYYTRDLPSVHDLDKSYAPPQMTRILASDGTLLGSIVSERRTVVPFESLPDHVKTAFLAAEDAGFYQHEGLDYWGLARALLRNLKAGQVRQGGSTITQQVVKNVLLSADRTLERKMKESVLAFRIEQELTKEQILGMYLNHIYLGHGRYGVEEAARYLFGKHAAEIDLPEAALLAGVVAAPERYSPRKNLELAKARRHYVLNQMLAKGFMTQAVFDWADAAPIQLSPALETESDIAPEAVEQARRALERTVGEGARRGGYTVVTTIDPELQHLARGAIRHGLDDYWRRQKLGPPFTLEKRRLWGKAHEGPIRQHGIYAGRVLTLRDEDGTVDVQVGDGLGRLRLLEEERFNKAHLLPSSYFSVGALVRVRVVDDPKEMGSNEPVRLKLELGPQAALLAIELSSSKVVAQVGSYEAMPGGLDRSTRARRQPGSSFKPVLYSLALKERAITAATVFEFPHSEDGARAEFERILLRQGIAQSDNRVAIATLRKMRNADVLDWARQLGIESKLGEGDSLALGAYEVTPLEMATAFSVFASGGMKNSPRFVERIGTSAGPLPFGTQEGGVRVMAPELAYLVTDLLTSVVQKGTGRFAQSLGRPVAGKTGTTNDAKDAWFVGYSSEYVVAVWVGYDDALPLGSGESGARTALPIWVEFMKGASKGKVATDFPRPEGLVDVLVDPETGLLARYQQENAQNEIFLPGTEPQEIAPEPVAPNVDEPGAAMSPKLSTQDEVPGSPDPNRDFDEIEPTLDTEESP